MGIEPVLGRGTFIGTVHWEHSQRSTYQTEVSTPAAAIASSIVLMGFVVCKERMALPSLSSRKLGPSGSATDLVLLRCESPMPLQAAHTQPWDLPIFATICRMVKFWARSFLALATSGSSGLMLGGMAMEPLRLCGSVLVWLHDLYLSRLPESCKIKLSLPGGWSTGCSTFGVGLEHVTGQSDPSRGAR